MFPVDLRTKIRLFPLTEVTDFLLLLLLSAITARYALNVQIHFRLILPLTG